MTASDAQLPGRPPPEGAPGKPAAPRRRGRSADVAVSLVIVGLILVLGFAPASRLAARDLPQLPPASARFRPGGSALASGEGHGRPGRSGRVAPRGHNPENRGCASLCRCGAGTFRCPEIPSRAQFLITGRELSCWLPLWSPRVSVPVSGSGHRAGQGAVRELRVRCDSAGGRAHRAGRPAVGGHRRH
jgi:hypothetical protein